MRGELGYAARTVAEDGDEFDAPSRILMAQAGFLCERPNFEAQFLPDFPANGFKGGFPGDYFSAGEFEQRGMIPAGKTAGSQHTTPVQDHGADHPQGFGSPRSDHGRKSRRLSLSGRYVSST
jgi:hypothetical protein